MCLSYIFLYKNSPDYFRNFSKMFQQQQSQSKSPASPQNTQNNQSASPSHHYLHPSTLTQLSFQQPIQNSPIEQTKIKQAKPHWRCWSDQQHLKLTVLFRDKGPSWQEIHLHFEKRQEGQIKRHFFASLKKIYQQLAEHIKGQPATPTRYRTLQFKDLKKLIEEIRKHKHKSDETYTRSRNLLSRLMATQRPETASYNNCSQQDLQELKEILVRVKIIMMKKLSETSTAVIQRQEVQIQHNRIEKGYQSDSSSAFGQEELEERRSLPSIEQYREDQAYNVSNRSEAVQDRKERVLVVEEDEEKIKELLSREGLLQFQFEGEENQNMNVEGGGGFQDSDVLDNQSYQRFCTNEFIETNKASFKEKPGGARAYVVKTNNTDQTTK